MTDERTHVDWKFWLQWVVASTVGIAVSLAAGGFVLGFTAFWRMWPDHYYNSPGEAFMAPLFMGIMSGFLIGSVAGAVLGTLQWLVLRQRVSETGGWMGASLAGFVVGLIVSSIGVVVVMPRSEIAVPDEVLMLMFGAVIGMFGAMIGAAVGIMQWRVLRRQISRAGWWVLANTVGGAVAVVVTSLLIVFSVVIEIQFSIPTIVAGGIVVMLVGGGVYGAITGVVLVWLLRRPAGRRWLLLVGLGTGLGLVILAVVGLAVLAGVAELGRSAQPPPPPTPTPLPTPTPYQGNLPLHITGQDGKEMVLVPAGEFLIGSTDTDPYAESEEKPQHTVTLDAFYIDKTEVTNADFCRFLNEKGNQEEGGVTWLDIDDEDCWIVYSGGQYRPQDGYTDHPVVEVTWYGARAYAQWAGKRLPTEAEWEKAARGTDGRIYPWGNTWDPAKTNALDRGAGDTTPVGTYGPAGASPYGALDMAGNVSEWCADWYGGKYYQRSPARNPTGPDSGTSRVLRGSSWGRGRDRCAYRLRYSPATSSFNIGFRCAVSVSP